MKLKLTSILFALLLISEGARGETQSQITVAVLQITGAQKTLNRNIEALLTANLSADQRFSLVDRGALDKVLGEQALGYSGIISPETAARIGQLTGAKVLITGRTLTPTGRKNVVIIANIIGTETGKVLSHTLETERKDTVETMADFSQKLADTIIAQATNLIAPPTVAREKRLDRIIEITSGKSLPTLMIEIQETNDGGTSHAAETELGLILRKAGFAVVEEKSSKRADVLITGDAVIGKIQKHGDLVSCSVTVALKAKERSSGKIVSLDLQRSTSSGVGDQATARQALQNATDELAERLIPLLANIKSK